jgi:hypothetical protein
LPALSSFFKLFSVSKPPDSKEGTKDLELKVKKRCILGLRRSLAYLLRMRPPLDLACAKRTPKFRGTGPQKKFNTVTSF